MTPEQREIVRRRAKGICERCGSRRGTNVHHRIPRGMGGSSNEYINRPGNLVYLCGSGTTGCHGWIESHRAEARESGWLVSRFSSLTPDAVPLVDWCGNRFLIDNDGGRTDLPAPIPA